MTEDDIRAAAESVAEQIAFTMGRLAENWRSETLYAFALVVQDDFAMVYKAANTEGQFQSSSGGAASRWEPNGWLGTGMELTIDLLNERLGDPTFQVDPALEKLRPAKQAAWLIALFEGLRLAHASGHLSWGGTPIFAFCTVQGSGLTAWCALESARLVNPPELLERHGAEFADAWAGWESDEEATAVQAAYEEARASL